MRRFISFAVAAFLLVIPSGTAIADRSPDAFVLFPSATITADTATVVVPQGIDFSAAYIVVDVTEVGASQTMTLEIETLLGAAAVWQDLDIASAALTATGRVVYTVGLVGGATWNNAQITEFFVVDLPKKWRINMDVFNSANFTASIEIIPIGR